MVIFRSLRARIHYFFSEFFVSRVLVKIDRFDFNKSEENIGVVYRLGRQKLIQKLILSNFSIKYFENLSVYDRQRITKFSVLQDLLNQLFSFEKSSRPEFVNYIKMAIKNDQLF